MPDEQVRVVADPAPCKFLPATTSRAEAGSPEFAEDRTQVNSLNNKFLFDASLLKFMDGLMRGGDHLADLQARGLQSLDESINLSKQVHAKFFEGLDDRAKLDTTTRAQALRHEGDNAYVTRYDLSNPVTTGTGDAVRAAAYTPNRATDVAASGVSVSAEAVAANVANLMTATLVPFTAALQQLIESLATTNASIANVLAQAQPKSGTGTGA